jgi:hypothetical protein
MRGQEAAATEVESEEVERGEKIVKRGRVVEESTAVEEVKPRQPASSICNPSQAGSDKPRKDSVITPKTSKENPAKPSSDKNRATLAKHSSDTSQAKHMQK